MAWVTFKRDVDFTHESRAVTKYKKDMTLNLPKHIVQALPDGSYDEAVKPESDSSEVWLNG